jgi:aspartate/methionine/tyrosine aminotransferase
MEERTITISSASKELRMIGWRVGWIVGPEKLMEDIRPVCRANMMAPTGIAQEPVALALERSSMTLGNYVDQLKERRDYLLTQLSGLPVGVPAGGWGMFLRVSDFGYDRKLAYAKLLKEGVVVNVDDWAGITHASQYVCLMFSNASLQDMEGVGIKIRRALGAGTC